MPFVFLSNGEEVRFHNRETDTHASRTVGFRLHPLKGRPGGPRWSVCVSGNWCVVLRFENGEAVEVDQIDYHWPNGSADHE